MHNELIYFFLHFVGCNDAVVANSQKHSRNSIHNSSSNKNSSFRSRSTQHTNETTVATSDDNGGRAKKNYSTRTECNLLIHIQFPTANAPSRTRPTCNLNFNWNTATTDRKTTPTASASCLQLLFQLSFSVFIYRENKRENKRKTHPTGVHLQQLPKQFSQWCYSYLYSYSERTLAICEVNSGHIL